MRVRSEADVRAIVDHPELGRAPKFILGGGSNIVLTRDVADLVVKVELRGMHLVEAREDAFIVEVAAPGSRGTRSSNGRWPRAGRASENLALIPGTVGAAPVQNIGATESSSPSASIAVGDRPDDRAQRDLGREQCRFGYRDSVSSTALAGKSVITRVRLPVCGRGSPCSATPKASKAASARRPATPRRARTIAVICARSAGPNSRSRRIGNAGSFFKNPVVSEVQCRDIIGATRRWCTMPDGSGPLAAGWLIDAWAGRARASGARRLREAGAGARQPGCGDRREVDACAGDPGKRLWPVRYIRLAAGAGGAVANKAAAHGCVIGLRTPPGPGLKRKCRCARLEPR